jgi:hypothetical protein
MKGGKTKIKMTEQEDNDFDEELEMEEEAVEEEKKEKAEAKSKNKSPAAKQAQVKSGEGAIKERYAAIHQPERIVVVDNVAGTIILEGFKDEGAAAGVAMMLNQQEKIITSLGA